MTLTTSQQSFFHMEIDKGDCKGDMEKGTVRNNQETFKGVE